MLGTTKLSVGIKTSIRTARSICDSPLWARALSFGAAILCLDCGCYIAAQPSLYRPNGAGVVGTASVIGINSYPCGGAYSGQYNLQYSQQGAQAFQAQIASEGWKTIYNGNEASPQTIPQDVAASSVLYFVGHGDIGTARFTADDCGGVPSGWGVGSTDGSIQPYLNNTRPVNGLLNWMYFSTSDTVSAPPVVDPADPDWTSNWIPAFGGSLHGMYGYWQAPGTCNDPDIENPPPGRECDVDDSIDEVTLARHVALYLYGSSGIVKSPHDSWIYANMDVGRQGWSITEDAANRNDVLSGAKTSNPMPSGSLYYYWSDNLSFAQLNSVVVQPTTFWVTPKTLKNESLSDAMAIAGAQSVYGQPVTAHTDNGSTSSASVGGIIGIHDYGTSGATIMASAFNGWAPSQSAAQNAAAGYIQETQGMPGDAVLVSTRALYQAGIQYPGQSIIGYSFTWRHSSPMFGGDALEVIVDAPAVGNWVCTQWALVPIDGGGGAKVKTCVEGYYTYTYPPHIVYSYRLWRSFGVTALAFSNGTTVPSSGGMTSIDAYTASLSLPPQALNAITAYQSGYWSGGPDEATSSRGAIPAWIFTIGGTYVAGVDAVTGAYLGSHDI